MTASVSLANSIVIARRLGPGFLYRAASRTYGGQNPGLCHRMRASIGLDSLEAIAHNAPRDATRVSVVADAQRGDLYVAEFSRQAAGAAVDAVGGKPD